MLNIGTGLTPGSLSPLAQQLQPSTSGPPPKAVVDQAAVQHTRISGEQHGLHRMQQDLLELRAHVRGLEHDLAAKGPQMPLSMREAIKRELDAAHRKLDQLVGRVLDAMPHLKDALAANAHALVTSQVKLTQAVLMPGSGVDVAKVQSELKALAQERAHLMAQVAPQTHKLQDAVLDARHDLRRIMDELQKTQPGPQREHLLQARDQAHQRLQHAMGQLEGTLPEAVRSKFADLRADNRELHEQAMDLQAKIHSRPPPSPAELTKLDKQFQTVLADQRDNAYQMDKLLGF